MFPLNTNDGIRDRLLLLLLQASEDVSALLFFDFPEVCCSLAVWPYVGINRPGVLIDVVVVWCGLLCPRGLVDTEDKEIEGCPAAQQQQQRWPRDGTGATCIIHSPE